MKTSMTAATNSAKSGVSSAAGIITNNSAISMASLSSYL
jgi:hypothetical protein